MSPAPGRRRKRGWIIGGAGALALVAAVGGAALVLRAARVASAPDAGSLVDAATLEAGRDAAQPGPDAQGVEPPDAGATDVGIRAAVVVRPAKAQPHAKRSLDGGVAVSVNIAPDAGHARRPTLEPDPKNPFLPEAGR